MTKEGSFDLNRMKKLQEIMGFISFPGKNFKVENFGEDIPKDLAEMIVEFHQLSYKLHNRYREVTGDSLFHFEMDKRET